MNKLKTLAERNEVWLPLLQALMETISVQTTIGPIAMAVLIYHTLNKLCIWDNIHPDADSASVTPPGLRHQLQ